MSPEHGPFQQEKYSSNHHFSGVMLQGGPLLVWNGVKTALNGQKQVGNWGYFTPISGVMGPLLIAGDGVYLVVFEVSGETEGAESKAVGPTVGFRTSEGSEASWRAHLKNWPTSLLDVKICQVWNMGHIYSGKKIFEDMQKNMLRAILTWKSILDLNYCDWLGVLSSHFPFFSFADLNFEIPSSTSE